MKSGTVVRRRLRLWMALAVGCACAWRSGVMLRHALWDGTAIAYYQHREWWERQAGGKAAVPLVTELEHGSDSRNGGQPLLPRKARTLLGIFSCDCQESDYRTIIRELYQVHPKVCSLSSYQRLELEDRDSCELIYTFVIAGGNSTTNPMLVDDSIRPITVAFDGLNGQKDKDLDRDDIIFLNIRENMDEGKTQTWFYYASKIMIQWDIDYVGKTDVDSLWQLDRYFAWSHLNLPPPPYNTHILASLFADKYWWEKATPKRMLQPRKEKLFGVQYRGPGIIHLYAQGQMYLMSADLANLATALAREDTAEVAVYKGQAVTPKDLYEGFEDHDMSALVTASATTSINYKLITVQQKFWKHPLKIKDMGYEVWRAEWDAEIQRLRQSVAEESNRTERAT